MTTPESMRKALAALQLAQKDGGPDAFYATTDEKINEAIAALESELAAPVQEPVAWQTRYWIAPPMGNRWSAWREVTPRPGDTLRELEFRLRADIGQSDKTEIRPVYASPVQPAAPQPTCDHMAGSCPQCHQCLLDAGKTHCPVCEPQSPSQPALAMEQWHAEAMKLIHAFMQEHVDDALGCDKEGGMRAPSCLCCGHQTGPERPIAVQHLELPAIVVCKQCKDAAGVIPSDGGQR